MSNPSVNVIARPNGGVTVTVNIPGFESTCALTIDVDPMDDGDSWAVCVPWPEDLEYQGLLPDGHEICNGVLYIGAPDDNEVRP